MIRKLKLFIEYKKENPEILIRMAPTLRIYFKCRNREQLLEQLNEFNTLNLVWQKTLICKIKFIKRDELMQIIKPVGNLEYFNNTTIATLIDKLKKLKTGNSTNYYNLINNISPVDLSKTEVEKLLEKIINM